MKWREINDDYKKRTVYLRNCKMIVARAKGNIFVRNERVSSLEMTLRTQWSSSLGLKIVKNSRSWEQLSGAVTPASDLDQQRRRPLTWLWYHVKTTGKIPTDQSPKDTAHNTDQRSIHQYFCVVKTLEREIAHNLSQRDHFRQCY